MESLQTSQATTNILFLTNIYGFKTFPKEISLNLLANGGTAKIDLDQSRAIDGRFQTWSQSVSALTDRGGDK